MGNKKEDRLTTLNRVNYTAGEITTIRGTLGYQIPFFLEKSDKNEAYFIANEYSLVDPEYDSVYHLPFLFNDDGTPWYEANLYFYRRSIDLDVGYGTTDDLRREASMLLDYKIYCDVEGINYLDFSAKRPGNRPTYRYFKYLIESNLASGKNKNKRTGVIYSFYKFLTNLPGFSIDIKAVDKTREAFIIFENGFKKKVTIRSQTVNVSNEKKPVPVGFVRDEGEDLRPLTNRERDDLIEALNGGGFSVDERLIYLIALNTGCRKQSIFTLRMKHVKQLRESLDIAASIKSYDSITIELRDRLAVDGTLILHASPSTGIDTKFQKVNKLHFPKDLAKQIITYAYSKEAEKRRNLFKKKYKDILDDDDIYLFLSQNGNCHYMARNDPRYRKVKTRPKGEHTDYLKTKLFKHTSESFPKDFTFHWLRATFAFYLYQHFIRYVVYDRKIKLKPGQMRPGDEIRKIQVRLHHKNREITENYLKLFVEFDDKIDAQERYEAMLFDGLGV
ncbi:integrase [Pseudoalteromonas sp. NCCP-2140]|uniref:hypothetical protein n=1 Tax=Pseudoalteromonas sp. NCCP-2140 TaxID=2942288 RepID=UPI00203F090D|nr:hypothetical protein [Pseudoalteromonas sp. NCCP-2140]GKW51770.1 integrase [Pseudoalteromonas sp. NCCP-2140]